MLASVPDEKFSCFGAPLRLPAPAQSWAQRFLRSGLSGVRARKRVAVRLGRTRRAVYASFPVSTLPAPGRSPVPESVALGRGFGIGSECIRGICGQTLVVWGMPACVWYAGGRSTHSQPRRSAIGHSVPARGASSGPRHLSSITYHLPLPRHGVPPCAGGIHLTSQPLQRGPCFARWSVRRRVCRRAAESAHRRGLAPCAGTTAVPLSENDAVVRASLSAPTEGGQASPFAGSSPNARSKSSSCNQPPARVCGPGVTHCRSGVTHPHLGGASSARRGLLHVLKERARGGSSWPVAPRRFASMPSLPTRTAMSAPAGRVMRGGSCTCCRCIEVDRAYTVRPAAPLRAAVRFHRRQGAVHGLALHNGPGVLRPNTSWCRPGGVGKRRVSLQPRHCVSHCRAMAWNAAAGSGPPCNAPHELAGVQGRLLKDRGLIHAALQLVLIEHRDALGDSMLAG